MGKVKNREALLQVGDAHSRRIVLDVCERTLEKLDAYKRIRSIMRRDGAVLTIGQKQWDLSQKRHVYLLGAGKACNAMAKAAEDVLGDYLTHGIIIVKIHEPSDAFVRTEVHVGGHPLPNAAGMAACQRILELVDQAGPDDLFICMMSGGSSALMNCPVDGISLEDDIRTTDVLLKSGASILQINSVRRHISQVNGGRLAQRIDARGAELIGFNISDGVYNAPTGDIGVPRENFVATPIGPDQTTLQDALDLIRARNLAERLPKSVMHYLTTCGEAGETPKAFPRFTYYMVNTLPDSSIYATQACEELGLQSMVLTTFIEGESREVGTMMAAVGREIQTYHRPVAPPCVVIASGEAVTTIGDDDVLTGHGGPGQELTLSFAIGASKVPGLCMLSIDTEGTDGTTLAAGGLTDSTTLQRLEEKGIDVYAALRGHASFEALEAVGDVIVTGNTGTNLCDLNIMYVPEREEAE